VIRYSYLWMQEHNRGQEEGVTDRPCSVILVTADRDDERIVTVLPISHVPPADPSLAVEISPLVKRRLGLDDERSWVVLSEANRSIWPGPDLRPSRHGDSASVGHGPLPFAPFEEVRTKFIAAVRGRIANVVPRSE
jgi:hypothetical protein